MTQHFDPKHPFASLLSKDPYEFMHSASEKTRSFYSSWNEIATHLFQSQQAYMQAAMKEWWENSMRYSLPNYWTGNAVKPASPEPQQAPVSEPAEIEKDLPPPVHHPVMTTGKDLMQPKARSRVANKPVRKTAGRAPKGS